MFRWRIFSASDVSAEVGFAERQRAPGSVDNNTVISPSYSNKYGWKLATELCLETNPIALSLP